MDNFVSVNVLTTFDKRQKRGFFEKKPILGYVTPFDYLQKSTLTDSFLYEQIQDVFSSSLLHNHCSHKIDI